MTTADSLIEILRNRPHDVVFDTELRLNAASELSALQKENAELKENTWRKERPYQEKLRTHIAELERIVKVKDEALKLASEYCNINTGCSQMENQIVCEQIQSALALQPEK